MRRWYVANGGPLALIILGASVAGFSSRLVGLILVLVGVALWGASLRMRHPSAPVSPSPPLPVHRPDLRVVELKSTGSSGHIDFSAYVANYGTQQCRATFHATVNGETVECVPQSHDLIPDTDPKRVAIRVLRPRLGNLVRAFANEPTLYGRTLHFEAVADSDRAHEEWSEKPYDPENNRERYEIQQREWRIGRREATDADYRADRTAELLRERDEE